MPTKTNVLRKEGTFSNQPIIPTLTISLVRGEEGSGYKTPMVKTLTMVDCDSCPGDLAEAFLTFVSQDSAPYTEEELRSVSRIIVEIHQRYFKTLRKNSVKDSPSCASSEGTTMPAVTAKIYVVGNTTDYLFGEEGGHVGQINDGVSLEVVVDLTRYNIEYFYSELLHDGYSQPDEPCDRVKLIKKIPE